SPEQARYNLRRNLTDLRHALGPEAGRLATPSPRTLRLDLTETQADFLAFDAAVRRGDTASLEQAIRLYQGELLEGCADAWVVPEREARSQAYLTALETLAGDAATRRDFATAERYLRLALAADPLRETALRALMAALAARGEHAALTQV